MQRRAFRLAFFVAALGAVACGDDDALSDGGLRDAMASDAPTRDGGEDDAAVDGGDAEGGGDAEAGGETDAAVDMTAPDMAAPRALPSCADEAPREPIRPEDGCMPLAHRFALTAISSLDGEVVLRGFDEQGAAADLIVTTQAVPGVPPQLAWSRSDTLAVAYRVMGASREELRGRALVDGCLKPEVTLLDARSFFRRGTDNRILIPMGDGFALFPQQSRERIELDASLSRVTSEQVEDCIVGDRAAGYGPGGTAMACWSAGTPGRVVVVTWDPSGMAATFSFAAPDNLDILGDLALAVPEAGRVIVGGVGLLTADRSMSEAFFVELTAGNTRMTQSLAAPRAGMRLSGLIAYDRGSSSMTGFSMTGFSMTLLSTQLVWDGVGDAEMRELAAPARAHAALDGHFYGFTGSALFAWEDPSMPHMGCRYPGRGSSSRTLILPDAEAP